MSNIPSNAPDPVELLVQNFFSLYPAQPTCRWTTDDGHDCGAILPANPRRVSTHLRNAHGVGGDGKDAVACLWGNCHARPVQRRSLVRHVLTVHTNLLRWTCPQCWKTFSRRGTPHSCLADAAGVDMVNESQ